VSDSYPFVMNSGRLRDQWHTMTRTGASSELSQHTSEAFLAMHPNDASALALKEGEYVSIAAKASNDVTDPVVLPLKLDSGLRQGELFAPIHWSHTWSSSASVSYLYSDARDPLSGQPELKHGAVSVAPYLVEQHAYVVTRNELPASWLQTNASIWTKTKIRGGFAYSLANASANPQLASEFLKALSEDDPEYESIRLQNGASEHVCALTGSRIHALLFISASKVTPDRGWMESLLESELISSVQLNNVLRGEASEEFTLGRTVCSCFGVRERTIEDAIENKGCTTVESLGGELKCGTNCGSCKPELAQILSRTVSRPADAPKEGLIETA